MEADGGGGNVNRGGGGTSMSGDLDCEEHCVESRDLAHHCKYVVKVHRPGCCLKSVTVNAKTSHLHLQV